MTQRSSCPVDLITVNEYQPRIVAALVLVITFFYSWLLSWIIAAMLTIDFFLRAGKWGRYSPLAALSKGIIRQFRITGKPVDTAPKRFAAKLGGCLSMIITLFNLLHYLSISTYLSILLIVFAILESVFGYCVGCTLYQWKQRVWPKSSFSH